MLDIGARYYIYKNLGRETVLAGETKVSPNVLPPTAALANAQKRVRQATAQV